MSERSSFEELFKGRHFEPDVIIVAVRWYLRYKLSLRDIAKMMAEREISVDPSTILRWVRAFSPGFEKKWQRFARFIDPSWRVDETYLKVAGKWTYLYRGVDRRGRSTVSYLSRRRTVGAMKAYLRKASRMQKRRPRTVTLDGYAASHRAVREFSEEHPPGTPITRALFERSEHPHRARSSGDQVAHWPDAGLQGLRIGEGTLRGWSCCIGWSRDNVPLGSWAWAGRRSRRFGERCSPHRL